VPCHAFEFDAVRAIRKLVEQDGVKVVVGVPYTQVCAVIYNTSSRSLD
jgi:hypothetical protein